MKFNTLKISCLILLILFINQISAQTKFKSGYFINNSGDKVDCLIKSEGWKTNPKFFEYKLNENDKVKTGTLETVKSFVIDGISKYEKHEVMIGKDIRDLQPSKDNSELDFKKETLFLKMLIEGKVNLYQYEEGSLNIYFIKNPETSEVEQLVYKTYANQENRVKYNNRFRTQLYQALHSEKISVKLRNVDYKRDDLVEIVSLYTGDEDSESNTTYFKKTKLDFNLYGKTGIGFTSLKAEGSTPGQNFAYDNKAIFRIGVELELILPFNNNKWALFISPTYQSYENNSQWIIGEGLPSESVIETPIEYNSIETPIGIRHYFFLNDNSKLYLSGALVVDANLNSQIKTTRTEILELQSSANFMLGLGYQYRQFGVEALYFTTRDLLDRYVGISAYYDVFAFQLTYKFF